MAHPHMDYDPNGPVKRLREICLALPETIEQEAWGECTFRVAGKMFAMTDNNHHGTGRVAVWCKAPPMVQEILVASDSKRFFKPPYVGHKGWLGVRLDVEVDWDELVAILEDGWLMSAPKRLAVARRSTSAEVNTVAKRDRKRTGTVPAKVESSPLARAVAKSRKRLATLTSVRMK
ncbi:MAG: MmcQ/YjbR family DNA-binding protein [Candidatus Binatus sp.]|uniref:MmcQ/YjbR family DNA-binding protein n=1 Tax=Candidatus Binatus sp. TaxID=2811406 RepID=UPI002718226C|nr:MmcQ/YjbR family DNA-binding protein [Candidatus Binatus sp.]MDO8434701.1 MmcQ/YjbR family DNA-binding protein [Candidatus Binatus sp.]